MAVVFIGFLVAGMALPVLPIHVHNDLGFGSFIVGLITGSQFLSSLITRVWAGDFADRSGPKKAVVMGLWGAAAAGVLYWISALAVSKPAVSAAVLIAGRGVLGGAEGLVLTGAVAWGLATAGPANAGRVIAWVGTAMFGALAVGAPLGTALFSIFGFSAIAAATALLPFATVLLVLPMTAVAGRGKSFTSRKTVIAAVWLPGLGSALCSVGYGAILTFSVLLFASHGWTNGWMAVTAFAIALVGSRLFIGHLPDTLGGPVTAFAFALVEVLGLLLLAIAPIPVVGMIGAAFVGLGYSLVFPGFGVAVVRAAPPESRGMAMGLYSACLDFALAGSGPLLGLIGDSAGLQMAFFVAAFIVLLSTPVAAVIMRQSAIR